MMQCGSELRSVIIGDADFLLTTLAPVICQ